MSDKTNYIDQVGAFLDNELSGEELLKFNQELASNPELAKELNFQKETIEGIKQYRHAELKARLDSIQVGTSLWTTPAAKIITSVIVASFVGLGIYQLWPEPEEEPATAVEQINEIEKTESAETPLKIVDDKDEAIPEKEPDLLKKVEELPQGIVKTEREKGDTEVTEITTPEVPVPTSFDTEEPAEDDLEIPESNLGADDEPLESQLEIEIISNKRKYPFHYQVIEGRLLLYGNFDEEPYELLEISINDEKKLYLFFKDKYYGIEKGSVDVTPLQVVKNNSLISELEKLKNKDS